MAKPLTLVVFLGAWLGLMASPGEATPLVCSPCLFYGGDNDNTEALGNVINTFRDARVYDNAITDPGGWSVGGIFTNDLVFPGATFTGAHWEIRSGVSAGNGGTLVASGDVSGADFGYIPNDQNRFIGAVGAWIICYTPTVLLSGGTPYWFSCTPRDSGSGSSFEVTTSDANSLGTHIEDRAFVVDTCCSAYFSETDSLCFAFSDDRCPEFSFGVIGTPTNGTPVPEPASLVLLGTGLIAAVSRFRRRRSRSNISQ